MSDDLRSLIEQPVWMRKAACTGVDPDVFFPVEKDNTAKAKDICFNECSVQAECLTYALTNRERHGIWGGLSERERRQLRRTTNKNRKIT